MLFGRDKLHLYVYLRVAIFDFELANSWQPWSRYMSCFKGRGGLEVEQWSDNRTLSISVL